MLLRLVRVSTCLYCARTGWLVSSPGNRWLCGEVNAWPGWDFLCAAVKWTLGARSVLTQDQCLYSWLVLACTECASRPVFFTQVTLAWPSVLKVKRCLLCRTFSDHCTKAFHPHSPLWLVPTTLNALLYPWLVPSVSVCKYSTGCGFQHVSRYMCCYLWLQCNMHIESDPWENMLSWFGRHFLYLSQPSS